MKISKKSWHWKVYKWLGGYYPDNLCEYMGLFVVAFLLGLLGLAVIGLAAYALIIAWTDHNPDFIFVVTFLPSCIILSWLIIAGYRKTSGILREADDAIDSFAQLTWKYIKTKKRRICPLIELVD